MKIALFILIAITICGCNNDLDKKIIKCEDGNYYRLDWRIGGLYAPEKIDTSYFKIIRNLK